MEQKTPKSNAEKNTRQTPTTQNHETKNKFNKMLDNHNDKNAESRAIKSNSTK